jgi:hypothetical protein
LKGLGLSHVNDVPSTFLEMSKMTWQTEGIRGFYRGYSCYIVAIMFWMSALPITTEYFMSAIPELLNGKPKDKKQDGLFFEDDAKEQRPINF